MSDLSKLIERVEALTEPDRAVDARIQQALFPDQRVLLDGGKAFGPGPKRPAKYGVLADVDLSDWDDVSADPGDKDGLAGLFEAPFYTSSVDAALALTERMLPGWTLNLTIYPTGSASVSIKKYSEDHELTFFDSLESEPPYARLKPAIAIVLATLRALQEQEK